MQPAPTTDPTFQLWTENDRHGNALRFFWRDAKCIESIGPFGSEQEARDDYARARGLETSPDPLEAVELAEGRILELLQSLHLQRATLREHGVAFFRAAADQARELADALAELAESDASS